MDQAEGLRRLVAARGESPAGRPARSFVVTGGKGGVGTSNLALNLAIALTDRGARVVLVDADLGLANLDLLCGLTPDRDLGDVLAEGRPLSDAISDGPSGVRFLAGAHGARTSPDLLAEAASRLVDELPNLESTADYVLIDAGNGLDPTIASLAESADGTILVTTPEPASMADASASICRLGNLSPIRLVVNQCNSRAEGRDCLDRLAASSRQFLGVAMSPLGFVRLDRRVPRAVRSRQPFVVAHPRSAASCDIRRIAATLLAERHSPRRPGFLARLLLAGTRASRRVGSSPEPAQPSSAGRAEFASARR